MAATLRLRCAVNKHMRTMAPNVPLLSAAFQTWRISSSPRTRARAAAFCRFIPFTIGGL